MVGAVLVQGGVIIGEGFHRGVGTPHAEAAALAAVSAEAARGATLYVSLEPCSHTDGGRTPCVARCLDAGVARVVAAHEDPDERVSGRGFAQLRAAGVAVVVGVLEDQARSLNEAYLKHRTTGLPFVTHKAAMTLDGKIATAAGNSRWVTSEAARAHVHRLRDRVDAIVVGGGTVEADNPQLTTRRARGGNGHDPLRVVVDSKLKVSLGAAVVRPGTLFAFVEDEGGRRRALEAAGAEVSLLPPDTAGRVDVRALAALLGQRGALSILLEGGGELAASFWRAGLVDKALFFIAPKILGGRGAKTPVEGADELAASMDEAIRLGTLSVRRFGEDIALEGKVQK